MSKIQGRQPAARMCFRNTGSWTGSWSRAKGQGVHAGLGAVCLVLGTLCPAVGQLHRAGQWEKSWRCSIAPLQLGTGLGVWALFLGQSWGRTQPIWVPAPSSWAMTRCSSAPLPDPQGL